MPPSVSRRDIRPIKVERRAALLRSIARGRAWLEAVASSVETIEDIAALNSNSVVPIVGASGAIAGKLAPVLETLEHRNRGG